MLSMAGKNIFGTLLPCSIILTFVLPVLEESPLLQLREKKTFNHLATKSPYTRRPISQFIDLKLWTASTVPNTYVPFHIDALYRHGTRFPSKSKLQAWWSTLTKLRSFDRKHKLKKSFMLWKRHFPHHRNYTLHKTGWNELTAHAEKVFKIAPKALCDVMNWKGSLLVMTSPKLRVLASANAFITKLQCLLEVCQRNTITNKACGKYKKRKILKDANNDRNGTVYYGKIPVSINAQLLRTFDNCSKYSNAVENNKTADFEHKKFLNSQVFQRTIAAVSYYFEKPITAPDVISLYQLCTFESALFEQYNICDLFTIESLQVMEYAADLKHYYKTGYGYDINFQLSCRLLQDIILRLDIALRKSETERNSSVVLRFGHAETLIPLLCFLNFYKDGIPLTADSFQLHRHMRLFRTGTFSPFAGSVMFLLYHSISEAHLPVKLAVISNDHLIKMPIANNCYFCDYNIVREYLYSLLAKFNCKQICHI
ncbi:multiple inositol polyphosphate phosphatase 1-like isoform X1 [Clavelina lepadiformis]|uniref:multiple inositol polyphosphate phosphatase 1-like isoform X1 n=1 Tax=Clavelina lepadiformis TaxID=159417 RepID=UPI004041E27B